MRVKGGTLQNGQGEIGEWKLNNANGTSCSIELPPVAASGCAGLPVWTARRPDDQTTRQPENGRATSRAVMGRDGPGWPWQPWMLVSQPPKCGSRVRWAVLAVRQSSSQHAQNGQGPIENHDIAPCLLVCVCVDLDRLCGSAPWPQWDTGLDVSHVLFCLPSNFLSMCVACMSRRGQRLQRWSSSLVSRRLARTLNGLSLSHSYS